MDSGVAAYRKGQMDEAARLFEQARMVYTRELGADHPDTLDSMSNLAICYQALGRVAEALKLNEEVLVRRRHTLGLDHPDTLISMNNLATSYSALGRYADALKLNEETLVLRRNKQGTDNPDTLTTMANLANNYHDLGREAEALKLDEKTLALRRNKLGADHPDTLVSMSNLAASYSALGRYTEALKLNEETLVLRRNKLGADHPDTLASMNNLANSYRDLGRYAEALKLNEEVLARNRQTLRPDHPATLVSMDNLAASYSDLGRYTEALKLNEETLTLRRNKLGANHPDTLNSMANIASNYRTLGREDEALKLNEEVLAIRLRILGADHPDTLDSMNNLATSYGALGRQGEALKLHEEVLAIRRRTLGSDHPKTLSSMNNLANSYRALGRYAEALKLNEETLEIRRRTLGADHPETLTSMNNLANSYSSLGREAEALKLQEETLVLRRNKLGADHVDTLTTMANLANSYRALGRETEAMKLDEEALARRRRTLGADHPDTLTSMNNLADSYRVLGRQDEAMKLDEEVLATRSRIQGADHPNTLSSMSNLALDYRALGRETEALKLNEEVLARRRRTLGADHPDTLVSMNNQAAIYNALGRWTEAMKITEETLALRRHILGADHPDTLFSMNNLAIIYLTVNRRPESLALRRQSLDVLDHMGASLKILPRDQRSSALASYQAYYIHFAQVLASNPADYAEALTVTERGKARSLLEELTARQAIANSGIPADASKRLNEFRSQLEYLDGKLAAAPNDEARQPLSTQRNTLRAELETLNQDLLTQYPRYAALSVVKPVTLEQGRALLPANGAFISWLFDEQAAGVALALPKSGNLLVLKAEPGPQMINRAESYRWLYALPDADSFATAVQAIPLDAWQQDGVVYIGAAGKMPKSATTVSANQYMALRQPSIASHGQWLSDTLLKPLAAQIDPASQWIISPDGVLATIPWDTLPWSGRPLGEQKQLTVIQSLSVYKLLKDREADYLSERAKAPAATHTLLVMGGAQYESGPDKHRSFQRSPQTIINGANTEAAEYQRQGAYDYMRSRHWSDLGGSLGEAKALHSLMEGKMFTGRDASKTKLRELSQSGELAGFQNVHFAAHGYLDTTVPSLSALVLTATGKDEDNDGYITAGEWPAYKLKSDLLVMSACETGLGKVVSGEGVQGLPYALYVAGNRDTLLSLWQVSDDVTPMFMKSFWAKVKAGQNHAQALTETKREFQRGDFGKAYSEPYYWAAFVLYGVQE